MNRIHSIAGAGLIALLGCTAHPAEPGTIHVAERAALEAAPTSSDPHAAHRATPAPADPHAGHTPEAKTAAIMPTGYSAVTIDPSRPGGLQITTAKIEEQEFVKQLRTIGVVTLDETRSAHVHPKVRGWIDGIAVNFIGRKVRAGEALCSLYSQEVFAAELEFLAILDRASTGPILTGEFAAEEVKAQQQLVGSARRRLALWDVPKAEIARLESTRTPRRTFALSAPRSGVVVAKQALDGMFVDPSVELYTLSDLSHLWV
ncbi:MAG: efflux RND transporter periplasmic adaptor subunit, partial [Minicystis sp.]